MSWQELLSNGESSVTDKMKFVMIQPVLDFNALEPGYQATKLIRNVAQDLKINAENGGRMRLTGTVAVADEEFATLSEDAALNNSIIVGAIVLFLWLALRSGGSWRGADQTFAGLVITAALGLVMVQALNTISVAFAALFVGLGGDSASSSRCATGPSATSRRPRARSGHRPRRRRPLALAAVSLVAGFFAFLPTESGASPSWA